MVEWIRVTVSIMPAALIEPDRPWGAAPVNFRVAADCAPSLLRLNLPASSARATVLMAVGRLISWIVLLGVPAVCLAVAVLAPSGTRRPRSNVGYLFPATGSYISPRGPMRSLG